MGPSVDKGQNLYDFQKLRAKLQEFNKQKGNEFKFRPIEKWMTEELGVERLPNKGGSHIVFRHEVLERVKLIPGGTFRVALKKGSKKPMIYRSNFLEYLYPQLSMILGLLEEEVANET